AEARQRGEKSHRPGFLVVRANALRVLVAAPGRLAAVVDPVLDVDEVAVAVEAVHLAVSDWAGLVREGDLEAVLAGIEREAVAVDSPLGPVVGKVVTATEQTRFGHEYVRRLGRH